MKKKDENNKNNMKSALTERKIEYLVCISLGLKNSETAKILVVSESTVKKASLEIYKILNAKDRANAVTIGFIKNILNEDIIDKIAEKYNIQQ